MQDEIARAKAAEKSNADAISTETSRATSVEKSNSDAINSLNGAVVKWGVQHSQGGQLSPDGNLYGTHWGGWLSNLLENGVDFLRFRGNSGDLNWSLTNGIWAFGNSTIDRPDNQSFGVVLVLNNGADSHNGHSWIFQIALSTVNNNIYLRHSINATGGGSFSKWVKFTGVEI